MTLTKADEHRLLHLLLDMGEMMLCSGGEVNRVENTLTLISKAYGAVDTSVFVITSSIVITLKFSDNNVMTETRRIKASGNNLRRLENLNALSRRCCSEPMPIEQLHKEIKACDEQVGAWKFFIGSALAAGSFAVFFGGNIFDGIASAIFALLVCLMQRKLSPICPNNIVFNAISSFILGIMICLLAKFAPIFNADKIMIGDIMLLIPGITITNSIRDILVGDTISGIMRFIESLLWAAGLALGFMLSILLVGGGA